VRQTSWLHVMGPSLRTLHPGSIVHTTVGTGLGDLAFAGLVGGLAILLGVVVAEWGVRLRERRRDLNRAADDLFESILPYSLGYKSDLEINQAIARFSVFLGRVSYYARRPLRHAGAIRAEARAISKRQALATAEWFAGGPPPNLRSVLGLDLGHLVTGSSKDQIAALDAELKNAGFPSLEDWSTWAGWTKVPLRIK